MDCYARIMQDTTFTRLKQMAERHGEIEREMSRQEIASNPTALRKLGQEYNELQTVIDLWTAYKTAQESLDQAKGFMASETDPEMLDLARSEASEMTSQLDELDNQIKAALLPKDATEQADAVVEIRAGAGGDEAGLFASDLLRMYQRYAERRGWSASVISLNATGVGGIKEVIFEVEGEGAYSRLKHESGVHRVQRVPATESQGRIHTSTATVAVLRRAEEIDIQVNDSDLKIDVFHAGGHGGQNVNKVATAIRVTHLPTGIVAICQNERSQLQNRAQAMEILRSRLWDRELRRRQAETSADKRAQVGTGDRSEKIRTYNYPQTRITDHRINHNNHQLERVLDGDLDEFIDALLREEQALKLAALAFPAASATAAVNKR